jgi:hypothetical protein
LVIKAGPWRIYVQQAQNYRIPKGEWASMQKAAFGVFFLLFAFGFYFHMLALIQIIPIYISSPLLFLSILCFFLFLNNRNKFKGFH